MRPRIPISRDEAMILTESMPTRKEGQTDKQYASAKSSAALNMKKAWKLSSWKGPRKGLTYCKAEIERRKAKGEVFLHLSEAA